MGETQKIIENNQGFDLGHHSNLVPKVNCFSAATLQEAVQTSKTADNNEVTKGEELLLGLSVKKKNHGGATVLHKINEE